MSRTCNHFTFYEICFNTILWYTKSLTHLIVGNNYLVVSRSLLFALCPHTQIFFPGTMHVLGASENEFLLPLHTQNTVRSAQLSLQSNV
jgi:hypothetical protein